MLRRNLWRQPLPPILDIPIFLPINRFPLCLAIKLQKPRRDLKSDRLLHDDVEQDERLRAREEPRRALSVVRERVEHARRRERLEQKERQRARVGTSSGDDDPGAGPEGLVPDPADEVPDECAREAPHGEDPETLELAGGEFGAHLHDDEAREEEDGADVGHFVYRRSVDHASAGNEVADEEGEENRDRALECTEKGGTEGRAWIVRHDVLQSRRQ